MKRDTNVSHVSYLAVLERLDAGLDAETLELAADTALDVFEQTRTRHGSDEPVGHCKVAINDRMADWSEPVNDGDTVLLFPPVGGG